MLKPKMVFTVLAVWWAFHVIILWILNPIAIEALVPDDKAQLMNRSLGYMAGSMSMMIAFIFYMLRSIDHSEAKQILLGAGVIMVVAVGIIIASNMSVSEKFPTETMMGTPPPAVGLWILLTVYTLYVALNSDS
tara:strand:+ start:322 stop:723 length:402 start_codon:yes stop_codon:yes gene_type:complete